MSPWTNTAAILSSTQRQTNRRTELTRCPRPITGSSTLLADMGVFRGGPRPPRPPPPIAPKNCRSTTTKDRLAALLLLQCQAYWIRKPDDSTSFSSVNELKEIAEVVLLIDISAAFLSCVLCVHIATGLAKKATPQYSTYNSAS